ncbi:MAG: RNA polymerase sigma factor [Thermomicrobiales bacterium]
MVEADERRSLHAALSLLTDDQRQVVELRLAGLTGPEIAEIVERSHAAVKMLQLRAIERLRQILDPPIQIVNKEDDHARR